MHLAIRVLSVLLILFSSKGLAQTNKVANFSFEEGDSQASHWSPMGGGYARVQLSPTSWDGSYAVGLLGPASLSLGLTQRISFNQTNHVPILITTRIKGDGVANLPGDNLGGSFDCRVKFVGLSQLSYCPTTAKTKNIGTFDWRYIGFNTADLVNGHLPIEWLEVRLRRGAVSGTVWFDDVQVSEFPQGTFAGAATLMFDDCYKEHRTVALSALSSFGWRGVEAAVTSYLSSGDGAYCSLPDLWVLSEGGWEIVSHSVNHPDLTTLNPVAMEDQFYWSKRYFAENGFTVKSFALPFGGYNTSVLGLNAERGYFSSVRSSDEGYNPMGTFPNMVKVKKVEWNTTASEVATWLSEARSRKAWAILLFHKIRPSCSDRFCVTEQTFQSILTTIQTSVLPVVTYEEGLILVKSPR